MNPRWFRSRVPKNQCPPVGCWAWENSIAPRACRVESGRSAVGDVRRRGLAGPCHRRPRRCGRRGGIAGHRQKPSGARGCRDGQRPQCRSVHRVLRVAHQPSSPSMLVARLLRAAFGVDDLDAQAARDRVAAGFPAQTPRICCCLTTCWDRRPDCCCPAIDPDARRRRLTALVNATSLAREAPAVYVVEDAHWIDEVSESMLAEFISVIPQTPSHGADHLPPRVSRPVDAGCGWTNDCPCTAE